MIDAHGIEGTRGLQGVLGPYTIYNAELDGPRDGE